MINGTESIVDEVEFQKLVTEEGYDFFRYLNMLRAQGPRKWVKRHFAELVARALEAEIFLDDHGARNNKQFSYLRELVASLLGFARVACVAKHLVVRFPRYKVVLNAELAGGFLAETDRTINFLIKAVEVLVDRIGSEAERIGVVVPTEACAETAASEVEIRRLLPHNIEDEDVLDEGQKIAEVATRYLTVCDRLAWAGEHLIESQDELKSFVLNKIDEERARYYESLVHSLQSKYDTYVASTVTENQTPGLRRLRGHSSMTLHLLEMGTELVHFYVRHENDVRNVGVRGKIAEVIDKREVLDRVANYAFYFASRILLAGRPFAEEALSSFVHQEVLSVSLPENKTLHARPISLIVKVVQHHGTHVEMEIGGQTCNGASIMEIIMLAGNCPESGEILFRGDVRPLEHIRLLFEHGLGERGIDKLPAELLYLR